MSMDSDLLTPEVQAVLARLLNQAPAMSPETVVQVIREELGADPDQLFQTFEPTAMAAASLGQVHRATRADGAEVAVKVQYPGIVDALKNDLDNLQFIVKAVSITHKQLDGRAYYDEVRGELMLEVDYLREARLCREFEAAVKPFPDLVVPTVFDDRTTRRVLTQQFLPGPTLKDFLASDPSPSERFRVARLLVRAIYGPFLTSGLIHADPHPGNFVLLPDGRLGILDFGSIKSFTGKFLEGNQHAFREGLRLSEDGGTLDAVEMVKAVGFQISPDLPDAKARAFLAQILHIVAQPLRVRDYDFGQDEMTAQMRKLFASNLGTVLQIRPPPEAILFYRAVGGLAQNLKALRARGDFRAVYEELSAFCPR